MGLALGGRGESGPSLPTQHLAAQQTYNHLDMSVGEALRQRTLCLEGVLSCLPEESLGEIIDRIVREQVACAGHTCSQPHGPSHEGLQPSPYVRHLPGLGVHMGLQRVLSVGSLCHGPQPASHPREIRTTPTWFLRDTPLLPQLCQAVALILRAHLVAAITAWLCALTEPLWTRRYTGWC